MLRYTRGDLRVVDGLAATFSVNRQADGRFEQARPGARLDRQEAETIAFGYQAQANRDFGPRQRFIAGTELYDESIDARRELVDPTVTTASRPDIPDGTSYRSFGLFAQHSVDVLPNRLTVKGGFRYSSFRFATTPDPVLGVIEEEVDADAVTFQAAAVYALADGVNLVGSVNRAFRAANAADFGSIGLTGGGGFEISPSTAASFSALIGSTGATGAISTGERVTQLSPEVVYQYELGLKASRGRFSGALNGFDLELYDFIQRRALVFDPSIVGTTISGFTVVRVDATNLAYIAQDVRPIATRVNVDRARIRGFDLETEFRLNSSWTANGYFSLASGRILNGEYIRRMPPAMGGARLRWSRDRLWAEGVVTFAAEQTRFNSGDVGDARIGGVRTRASIGTFFNGTAVDMGLVSSGILLSTGETLAQVQNRVLGTASSAPLFTSHPGYAIFGLRAGMRLTPSFDVTVLGENLGDVNYRIYGSGLDAPGANLQVRARYRF
jgi:outer membrane receptor protein involved in Fe transport